MTVVLNEAGITALFASQPVVQFVQRAATEKIVEQTRQSVNGYFNTAPTLDVGGDVDVQMDGSTAVVGIKDAGSKSRRLARQGLIQKWLKAAVDGA